jgi:hypothetical protein
LNISTDLNPHTHVYQIIRVRYVFLDNEIAQTLTIEEHEWVSIDCKLRPEIYDAGFKPLFNLCLNQEELHRLLKVPKKLQHALGFVKNKRDGTRCYISFIESKIKKQPNPPSVRYLVHTKREWTYIARKTNKVGATEFT